MTKALITGITGMVGSHLLDYLIENTDWQIDGMIRWRSPLDNIEQHIPAINRGDRINLYFADLTDGTSVNTMVKRSRPDFVFHLAAQSFPKVSFESPLATYDVNVAGTERLLNAVMTHAPESVVHVCSSSEVFGRVPEWKLPIDEECSFHPASPYAISKIGTDLIGRHYAEAYGLRTLTTRMFTHTGPRRGDVFAESTFAKQIAMIEQQQIPPVIKVGNLDSLRTWADVRDAVRAYHMLVTTNPQPGQYYNIGGTFIAPVSYALDTLLNLTAWKPEIKIEIDPDRLRPIDADMQVPNTTKFRDHTGWNPEIPFTTTMGDLLAYWRERVKTREFLTR